MIDLADRIREPNGTDSRSGSRLAQLSTNILLFAIGCGAVALLYSQLRVKVRTAAHGKLTEPGS